MTLAPGTTLGPYEILSQIGAGGMGEVYKARDTRLNRVVAIKTSKQQFSERFEREAKVIASLNHPNICQLFDVGALPSGMAYLVMEYVEGPTLQDIVRNGAMPLDEALKIASQLCGALEEAHSKGVTHRDLKPANVKIKSDGPRESSVKVLDFGLAKIAPTQSQSPPDPEHSPTLTMAMTEAGMIVGTAAYMSPEQARGKPVDKRADIWAFGVMLHEMLTGERMFRGEDMVQILASVIMQEPDLSRIPLQVQGLLRSCLKKNPDERLHDIADAKLLLELSASQIQPVPPPPAPQPSAPPPRRSLLWPGIAGVFVLTTCALAFLHFREALPTTPSAVRFQISPPDKVNFGDYLALSPDGRNLAFTAAGADGRIRVWIRSMDALEARALPGTENAASPQWSPDGRYIAYGDGSKFKKVDTTGGPPQTLGEVPSGQAGRGSWNKDDVIIFANRGANPGVYRIPAAGGAPELITKTDPKRKETYNAHPVFLADGRHFLYQISSAASENTGIYVGSLDVKAEEQNRNLLVASQFGALYAPGTDPSKSQLLFLRDGTLLAQPFDANRAALTGDAVPVAEQVGSFGSSGYFTVSASGALAYRGGGGGTSQLNWFDRQGKLISAAGDPGDFAGFAVSPDGARAAMALNKDRNRDIWLLDFTRGANTRLTFNPGVDLQPVWSPDGSQVAFSTAGKTGIEIHQKLAAGVGEEQTLTSPEANRGANDFVQDWSHDGKLLLYAQQLAGQNLWVLPMDGDRKPVPFAPSSAIQSQGRFSPDSRWIAYTSNESGRNEIYVQPYPATRDGGGKWMISIAGGVQPLWRRDGKEILYIGPNGEVMAASIEAGATFKASIPKQLFVAPFFGGPGGNFPFRRWDISPDGQRFLIDSTMGASNSSPVTMILNWQSVLKK